MRVAAVGLFLLCFLSPSSVSAQTQTTPGNDDYSGMYAFLREGEFIQLTVEEKGTLTGFISRFGDSESDQGVFLNQFFKSGKLDGTKVRFTTESVHGSWFEFEGVAVRGAGKNENEEGYVVLRGSLTRFNSDADKKITSQARRVEFKSFPKNATSN